MVSVNIALGTPLVYSHEEPPLIGVTMLQVSTISFIQLSITETLDSVSTQPLFDSSISIFLTATWLLQVQLWGHC